MGLVIAGIDEAGYGPMLGPLCVGLAVFRLPGWTEPKAPNLWDVLEGGVCREPGRGGASDARGRVAVADSKQLKLSNSVKTTHPLVHLERGVLAFLAGGDGGAPDTDDALLERLGAARAGAHICYGGEALGLPIAGDAARQGIAANILWTAMRRAGVELPLLRCGVVHEPEFNNVVRASGSKAQTTAGVLSGHLREVFERWAGDGERERCSVVCDRLGGRESYAPLLRGALPGAEVTVLEENESRSAYIVQKGGARMGVAFLVEGEAAHMPVALASMTAKYVRELSMMRFNRYWQCRGVQQGVQVKPTAGYTQDARRFLSEIGSVMEKQDREALVRIA